MSKRHHSQRRRTYGRRQHEVHERAHRSHRDGPVRDDAPERDAVVAGDPLTALDARSPRLWAAGIG